MKPCIIMGFGRSGTSLMGGILHQAGYYMGDELYPPRHSNPKGFFENAVINGINERILTAFDHIIVQPNAHVFKKEFSPFKPGPGHRWLSYIPSNIIISCEDKPTIDEIRKALSVKSYAYKDPRFNYTLPVWLPYLPPDTLYICLFRDPLTTIQSVMTECQSVRYLENFYITETLVEQIWINYYIRVIHQFIQNSHIQNNIVFIHYNQLLSGEKLVELSAKLDVRLSADFVDRSLSRSIPTKFNKTDTNNIYNTLCQLSNHKV